MKKYFQLSILTLSLFALFFLNYSCEKHSLIGTGVLQGTISIGPICPVETDPPDPNCLPTAETYKAYPVVVWTSNGKRKVKELSPALDGSYSTDLPSGNYLIDLDKNTTAIGGSNLPKNIIINSNDTTFLNISIDTGIR